MPMKLNAIIGDPMINQGFLRPKRAEVILSDNHPATGFMIACTHHPIASAVPISVRIIASLAIKKASS